MQITKLQKPTKLVLGLLALLLIGYAAYQTKSVGDVGWCLMCIVWMME